MARNSFASSCEKPLGAWKGINYSHHSDSSERSRLRGTSCCESLFSAQKVNFCGRRGLAVTCVFEMAGFMKFFHAILSTWRLNALKTQKIPHIASKLLLEAFKLETHSIWLSQAAQYCCMLIAAFIEPLKMSKSAKNKHSVWHSALLHPITGLIKCLSTNKVLT